MRLCWRGTFWSLAAAVRVSIVLVVAGQAVTGLTSPGRTQAVGLRLNRTSTYKPGPPTRCRLALVAQAAQVLTGRELLEVTPSSPDSPLSVAAVAARKEAQLVLRVAQAVAAGLVILPMEALGLRDKGTQAASHFSS